MPPRNRLRAALWIALIVLMADPLAFPEPPRTAGARKTQPSSKFKFERTQARYERGRYLVENVVGCFDCHSQMDWKTGQPRPGTQGGGGQVEDDTLPFKVWAPNISPDPEAGAGKWDDEVFERALRQGIGSDGRMLFPFMPYEKLRHMADEDLASIIVYIRSIPPRRNKVPRTEWPTEMKEIFKPFPAPTRPIGPPGSSNPVKHGEYLVTVLAGCNGCHTPADDNLRPLRGLEFAGGAPLWGPWGRVASQNLTPDPSGIPHYDQAMFIKTMRTGAVNGVRPLNLIMPWKTFRGMTDADLKAIYAYLRSLKPVRHRVDNNEPPRFCKLCRYTHGFGEKN